jgi:hypothetical protein
VSCHRTQDIALVNYHARVLDPSLNRVASLAPSKVPKMPPGAKANASTERDEAKDDPAGPCSSKDVLEPRTGGTSTPPRLDSSLPNNCPAPTPEAHGNDAPEPTSNNLDGRSNSATMPVPDKDVDENMLPYPATPPSDGHAHMPSTPPTQANESTAPKMEDMIM